MPITLSPAPQNSGQYTRINARSRVCVQRFLPDLREREVAVSKLLALAILGIFLTIPVSEIIRRILVERKMRELLPDQKIFVKRLPIFKTINLDSVPKTKKGQEFVHYYKKTLKITLVTMISVILILSLPQLIIEIIN